jgi:hypothetical protein
LETKKCVQFGETKKLLTHFDPFPNKQTKQTSEQHNNNHNKLGTQRIWFHFQNVICITKNSFPSQRSICSFSKHHPSSKTKNQFPISFNSTFVSRILEQKKSGYILKTPTTTSCNILKLFRALQLSKSILLVCYVFCIKWVNDFFIRMYLHKILNTILHWFLSLIL